MSQVTGPLTALEWLRVTHAGTLSGRRIEEAVAAATREAVAEAIVYARTEERREILATVSREFGVEWSRRLRDVLQQIAAH
jgi:hypothetical protein